MTLGRRLRLLLSIVTVLLAASLVADVWLMEQRAALVRRLDTQLEPARMAIGEVGQGLVDQETGERGYVITHDPSFLEPYLSGGRRVDAAMAELRRLLQGDQELRAGLERLGGRISAWRQLGAEFEIAAVREGRFEEAVGLVSSGTGRRLFDQTRVELADLRAAVVAEQATVDDRLREISAILSWLTLTGTLSALALLGLGSYLLSGWISRPLAAVGTAVRKVAARDLHRPIPSPGPPELAQLGRDVESMRQRILAEVDDASRARDALAQRGLVVLSLSERLHPDVSCLPPGLRVATRYAPAVGVVAGDWCDIVTLGPDRAAAVVVDVSGHGAEAGIFALRAKELTLAALDTGLDPGQALAWVAARLGDTDERFFTGVVAEIDDARETLRYASAGHPPLLVVDGGSVQVLGLTGSVVGPALDPDGWATVEVPLSPTAVVVACTDGVLEARNDQGEEFGLDRLSAIVTEATEGEHVQAIADRCMAALDDFRGAAPHDDVTLVVFGRSIRPVPRPADGSALGHRQQAERIAEVDGVELGRLPGREIVGIEAAASVEGEQPLAVGREGERGVSRR